MHLVIDGYDTTLFVDIVRFLPPILSSVCFIVILSWMLSRYCLTTGGSKIKQPQQPTAAVSRNLQAVYHCLPFTSFRTFRSLCCEHNLDEASLWLVLYLCSFFWPKICPRCQHLMAWLMLFLFDDANGRITCRKQCQSYTINNDR